MTWAKENSIQLVITEQTCKYILPLKHPNKIQVKQYIAKIGIASMEFEYEIRILGSDQVITKTKAKLACYNVKTGRLQKILTQLKELILLEEND